MILFLLQKKKAQNELTSTAVKMNFKANKTHGYNLQNCRET